MKQKIPNGHPQIATVAIEQATSCKEQNNTNNPYEYSDKGTMATVKRHLAVVEHGISFSGIFAWLFDVSTFNAYTWGKNKHFCKLVVEIFYFRSIVTTI